MNNYTYLWNETKDLFYIDVPIFYKIIKFFKKKDYYHMQC